MRKIVIGPRNRSMKPLMSNQLFRSLVSDLGGGSRSPRFENTDIYEEDGTLHYKLELPGFEKDRVKVHTRKNKLSIEAERREENVASDRNYLARGIKQNTVRRSYPLPKGIDSAQELDAEFDNGILHISAPLPEEEEQETVEVKID